MDTQAINARCVKLFHNPDVRLHCWHPRMFWNTHGLDNPRPETLLEPKVDLLELEVMFSELAHVPSLCARELDAREPGRVDLIRHIVRRGEVPFLHRPQ